MDVRKQYVGGSVCVVAKLFMSVQRIRLYARPVATEFDVHIYGVLRYMSSDKYAACE